MKKLIICAVLIICFTGISLSAWEPEDLMKYPPCMEEDTWIINLGAGFDFTDFPDYWGRNYLWVPPVHVSFDRNVPLGDDNLPFFMGGIGGYTAWGHRDHWIHHRIYGGFRIGYHFNFEVENLDIYAFLSAVGRANFYTGEDIVKRKFLFRDWVTINIINLGVRYYVSDWFGFWVETGGGTHFTFNAGFSFKF